MATHTTELQRLYVAFFNRPADAGGLAYWQRELAAGASLASVAHKFSVSPEYQAQYAGLTSAQQVDALYQHLFGRAAEPAGLDYWVGLLADGRVNAGNVALAVMTGAQNADAQAVTHKVIAAQAFTAALAGLADSSAYSGPGATALARAWLSGVGHEPASLAEIQGGLSRALGAVIDAGLGRKASGGVTETASAPAPDTGTTVTNIETLNLHTAGENYSVDASLNNRPPLVNLTATVALAGGATAGALNVKGGSTVTVTQVATTSGALGSTATQGPVTVTGTTDTTSVSVSQTAAVRAVSTVAASTESSVITWAVFNAGGPGYQIAGGLKVYNTDNAGHSATEVATVAAGGTVTGLALISPTTPLWSVGPAVGATTRFTSLTPNANVPNVVVTGSGYTYSPVANTTQGVDAVAGVAGLANGAVTVTDVNAASATQAGTIAKVALNNFGAATVNSSAVTSVTLGGTGTSFALTHGALATPVVNTLALSLNGLTTTGAVNLGPVPSALDITTSGGASVLGSLSAAGATTVNISGASALTLSAQTFAANAAITSTSTAAVTVGGALLAGQAYSGGSGADTLVLSASGTRAISTGAGNDRVTYGGPLASGGSLDGGEGTDTLVMTSSQASTAAASTAFASTVSNFETLHLSGGTSYYTSLSMSRLTGFNHLSATMGNYTEMNISNAPADFTFTVQDSRNWYGEAYISLANRSGTEDRVNLAFNAADGGGFSRPYFYIDGVEQLSIRTGDTDGLAQTGTVGMYVSAGSAKSVTVAGDIGVSLAGGFSSALASLDASGLTAAGDYGGLTFTAGTLTVSSVIKGGAAGTNTVNFSSANTASTFVTYVGGSGADIVTVGAGRSIIDVGSGSDTVVVAAAPTLAANRTVVSGMGAGDILNVAGTAGGRTLSGQTSLGQAVTAGGSSSLADFVDAAAAGDGATGRTLLRWFQLDGSTYVVHDTSSASTFQAGQDSVVELVGLIDLSAATVAAGVITI